MKFGTAQKCFQHKRRYVCVFKHQHKLKENGKLPLEYKLKEKILYFLCGSKVFLLQIFKNLSFKHSEYENMNDMKCGKERKERKEGNRRGQFVKLTGPNTEGIKQGKGRWVEGGGGLL